jgi:hypothetical protein
MSLYKYKNEDVNIPVARLRKEGFTQRDVDIFEDIFPYDCYRELFGDDDHILAEYGLRYVGPTILDASEIIHDHKYSECQVYRAGGNGEATNIKKDIEIVGYKLKEIPSVVVKIDGKYYIWDGRTRNKAQEILGISNRLVSVYELIGDLSDAQDFGMLMNTIGSPKGYANEEDVKTYITSVVKSGNLNVDSNPSDTFLVRLKSAIREKLEKCNFKMGNTTLERFVFDLSKEHYGHQPVRVITSAIEARGICEREFGLVDTNEYVYVCTTPDTGVGDKKVQDAITNPKYFGKQIRVIYYESEPNSRKLEEHFKDRILSIKEDIHRKYREMGNAVFNGQTPDFESRYVIWGAIPYLTSMEDQYPMDKLIDLREDFPMFKVA